jgi:hypothetical protein
MMQRSFRRVIPTGLKFGLRPASAGLSTESYTDKQEKTGRPLSPHVDIYTFPPAAITSGMLALLCLEERKLLLLLLMMMA